MPKSPYTIPVPAGCACAHCGESFWPDDFGCEMPCLCERGWMPIYFHDECHLRRIVGSLSHLRRECSCFIEGSQCGDPPELTRRQAAVLACGEYLLRHGQLRPGPRRLQ